MRTPETGLYGENLRGQQQPRTFPPYREREKREGCRRSGNPLFRVPSIMDGGAFDYWVTYTPPSTLTTTGALETSPLVPQVMPVPVRPSTLKLLSVKVAMSFSQMS